MALAPSPPPKPRRRPWRALLIVVGVLAVGAVLAAACVPWLLIPYAEEQIIARVQARAHTRVDVDDVELTWGRVSLRGVQIAGGDGEPRIELDTVIVDVDPDALWSGRAVVEAVTVEGGRVEGSRHEFEDLLRRAREGRKPGARAGTGRVQLRPKTLTASDIEIALTARHGEMPISLDAVVSAEVDVAKLEASLAWTDVVAEVGTGLRARSVATTLRAARTDSGYALTFPIRAQLRGAAAPVTDAIAIAGADGWVEVSDAAATEISLEVEGSFGDATSEAAGEKLWSIAGTARRDLSAGVLRVDMDDFALNRIPADVLGRLPLVESSSATAGGHLAIVFGDGVAAVEGDLSVEDLGVSSATLARRPVSNLGFEVSFAAEVDPGSRAAVLHYVDIERDGVKVSASARIEHPPRQRGRRYDVVLDVPSVGCQAVLDAVPPGFAPALTGFRLGGEIDGHITAHVDYADLESLSLGGSVNMEGCEVLQTPPHAAVERLAGGFTHKVLMKDGATTSVQMYPGARGFASIRQVSPYVTAAIRSTEDGGFWRHNGFMPSQFEVALRRNLQAGGVRLGASTITMQMVKNVLLGHERTLSRKFQEMVLTWYVEKVLSKDRIMELYLNAIEYGPGVYGIVDAASYYFGKHPADLDPPEAVFLALMLPSPVKRSVYYCNGELSPRFAVKVARILRLMNERGRLTDLEYELWKDTDVVFDLRRRRSESGCHGRIKAMQAGTFTQMPLSGLLSGDALLDDPPPEPVEPALDELDLDPMGGELPDLDDLDDLDGLDRLPGSEDPRNVDDMGRPAMDDR